MSEMSLKGSVDYSKGKIYAIKNYDNNKIYIGSTTWDLGKRFNEHVKRRNDPKFIDKPDNWLLYQAMHDLGKDIFYFEEVESFPCENASQLRAREGYWIRHFQSWIPEYGYNKKLENRSRKEYYEDRREFTIEQSKKYTEQNREKVFEWKNTHFVCECGGSHTNSTKARHIKTLKHQDWLKKQM